MSEQIIVNCYNYKESIDFPIEYIGGKAYNTVQLFHNGILIPLGVIVPPFPSVCTSKCNYQYNFDNLLNYLSSISTHTYAVRSSAIGEDSHYLSWAGCFETSLDVKLNDIPEKVMLCQKSLFGDRALKYAELHKVQPLSQMGILIQEYIQADYHGVIFSVNPVTNSKAEYVIEYQKGTSGSVVGGVGNSTTIAINKYDKTEHYLSYHSSHIEHSVINLLVNAAQKVECIIDDYADIEWILSNNVLYITQARPVTTLQKKEI